MGRIKEGFRLHRVAGNSIVVAVGAASMSFNGMITLNATGEYIWKMLENGYSDKMIAAEMANEYGIDSEEAFNDVREFIQSLEGAGLLENKA